MKALKISSVIWLILFILLAIFIMMRHVDGAGVVQTMPIKLINLAVLAVFALIVLVGHLIWLLIVRKRQNIQYKITHQNGHRIFKILRLFFNWSR